MKKKRPTRIPKHQTTVFALTGLRWWKDPAGNILRRTPQGSVEFIPASPGASREAMELYLSRSLMGATA